MLRLLVLLLPGLATVLAVPEIFLRSADDIAQFNQEGNINDGHWYCPWTLSSGECGNGKFTCTCPGDRRAVYYQLGCCYKFPQCGQICNKASTCRRYTRCQTCRSGVGEWDMNGCLTCQKGFVLGTGNCQTDLDECSYANGNCDHKCINTYGSFYCQCFDGYKLQPNKLHCKRLSCGNPGSPENGQVTGTDNWLYESYAQYTCNSPNLVPVGSHIRQCDGYQDVVSWTGEAPICQDTCAVDGSQEQVQCGAPGTGDIKCRQLGCCYDGNSNKCFHKQGSAYLRYDGVRPTVSSYRVQDWSSAASCGYLCDRDDRCASYGMRTLGTDGGLLLQNCHLLAASPDDLLRNDGGSYVNDLKYQFYEPVSYEKQDNTYELERQSLQDKISLGCFTAENVTTIHAFTDDADLTTFRCIDMCRDLGYKVALTTSGSQCHCASRPPTKKSGACSSQCSGDISQVCGGQGAYSAFTVPADRRYLGCYHDLEEVRDLATQLWGVDSGRSASQCVRACRADGYRYAALQAGGDCRCGHTYGSHGPSEETECSAPCGSYSNQNCGGSMHNAVYKTELALDVSRQPLDRSAGKLYDTSGSLHGFSTRLFTLYPGLRTIQSKTLVVHSHEEIRTPYGSAGRDAYEPCGTIYIDEHVGEADDDVIVRAFFLRLSDLRALVGAGTRRVYVYAQTVLIDDQQVELHHSLFLRARQILVDRETAVDITISASAADLNVDDPQPDLMFQKQSFMCARILLETGERRHVNTAWSVLRHLASTDGLRDDDKEQAAFAGMARVLIAELGGVTYQDIHKVPLYTKSHMSEILKTFYNSITVYKTDYDRLLDATTSDANFLKYSASMQEAYTHTDVDEAHTAFTSTRNAIKTANATYHRMRVLYDESVVSLDFARSTFEKEIEDENKPWKNAIVPFIKGVVTAVKGIVEEDYMAIIKGMEMFINDTKEIDFTMDELAKVVRTIDQLAMTADETIRNLENLFETFDYERYVDDVESTVALQLNLVYWAQIKDGTKIILSDPKVIKVSGCKEYVQALLDTANWGEALTRSMVERAELTRQLMEKRAVYEARLEKQDRIARLLETAGDDVSTRRALLAAITEQTYDVRLDLNQALLTFCQAYFYENLQDCKPSYKPSFGGSLSQLLLKISAARRDELFTNNQIPSTVNRLLDIVDTDTDPGCRDATVCPVNYLRQNRVLVFRLPLDHPEFLDLGKYRVSEVVVEMVGAKPTADNTVLQIKIESSGDFQGKLDANTHYNFLTKPLTLAYEYDVITGHVSVHADVYDSHRQIVHHITPFTTWVLAVSQHRSADVDLSGVTAVRMRLQGSAVPLGMRKR